MLSFSMATADAYLRAAIEQARKSLSEGGIPIGSVLVHEGRIIGRGHNCRVQTGSAIDHGEMNCLRNAGRLPASVYRNSIMYSTLSPCPMCSGAIVLYRSRAWWWASTQNRLAKPRARACSAREPALLSESGKLALANSVAS